jgi:hypothetical protein
VLLAQGCASALKTATVAETAAVQGVHHVVLAEKAAYDAHAFDREHHRKYLLLLQRVVQDEAALNAALLAWARGTNQTPPEQVRLAVAALNDILNDIGDQFAPGSALGRLVLTVSNTLQLMVPAGGVQ